MLTEREIDEISRARADFSQFVEQVRADDHLSETGKAQKIGQAWSQQRAWMQGVVEGARTRTEQRATELRAKVFRGGPKPEETIAYRDALDRLENANAGETTRLLSRALDVGDDTLAKAALRRGFDRMSEHGPDAKQWRPVVDAYLDQAPETTAATVRELAGTLSALTDREANVRRSMLTSVPKPAEIQHLPDHAFDSPQGD